MDRITGANEKQLPWEEEKNRAYFRKKLGMFRNTLLQLVHRDPAGRPTMQQFSAACENILVKSTVDA